LHYMIALAVFACIGVIGILLYNKKLQKGGYDV
jgi:ABC-2 type transport system permease protein